MERLKFSLNEAKMKIVDLNHMISEKEREKLEVDKSEFEKTRKFLENTTDQIKTSFESTLKEENE